MKLSLIAGFSIAALISSAQTFTTLHSFNYADGQRPDQGLVLKGNMLYGTTIYGADASQGVVFR